MGLYTIGKAAALATIDGFIVDALQVQPDGMVNLSTDLLNKALYDATLAMIEQDVLAQNRPSANAVLQTVDVRRAVSALADAYNLAVYKNSPDFPTISTLSQSADFSHGVASRKHDMQIAAEAIEAEYLSIINELPEVLGLAYSEGGMGQNMPKTEERIVDTRFYVFTHVTDLGEESAPSPVSEMVEVDQRDGVNISIVAPPPDRHINRWRFYRSNSGTVGAKFQFFAEGSINTLSSTDKVLSSQLGELLPTMGWAEPPEKLRGLVNMPNGVIAGFVDNYVAFCDPYHPYAWPVEYQITTEFPIIALGAFGQTLVVMHAGGVDYISGADSASMSMQKDISKQVCASARSVVAVDDGVVFASSTGICLASQQGVLVMTEGKITASDWRDTGIENTHVVVMDKVLYVYGLAQPYFYSLNLSTKKLGVLTLDHPYSGAYVDRQKGRLYAVSGTTVYKLFESGSRTGVWRTKLLVMPAQVGFAWLGVESLFDAGPVTVRWYGDGVLRYTAVVANREPVRVPVGRWLEHEVEVESDSWVNKVTLASSGDELRAA
jgi:hypothetical protein